MEMVIKHGVGKEIHTIHEFIPEARERSHVHWVFVGEKNNMVTSELHLTNKAVKYLERYK
jgi:hypothetical protein